MIHYLRPAIVLMCLFTLVTGILYPLTMTVAGQALFAAQADGSLIRRDGRLIGSSLIGQGFTAPGYFHGRPSAAGTGYDAANSSGSNLGPASPPLRARIAADTTRWHTLNPKMPVPVDLVTTSASGLDPDISPEAALFQVASVARARHLPEKAVTDLVHHHTKSRLFDLIGEPRVNVLELNLALDGLRENG